MKKEEKKSSRLDARELKPFFLKLPGRHLKKTSLHVGFKVFYYNSRESSGNDQFQWDYGSSESIKWDLFQAELAAMLSVKFRIKIASENV